MKYGLLSASLATTALALGTLLPSYAFAQEAPASQNSDSVAKPRKPAAEAPPPDEAPIHTEYKKSKDIPKDTPTFHSNATTVSVDVSILDNQNHFIPGLSQDKFRILEDGVPQQISKIGKGQAPLTICMVIEFSGR